MMLVIRLPIPVSVDTQHSYMPELLQHGAAGLPAGKPGRKTSLTSSGLPESLNTERRPQIAAGR
jgi:hypothetical protein